MIRPAFWARAEASPHLPAVIEADGTRVSAGELLDRSRQLQSALAGAGLRRGDHVAFLLPNGPDIIAAALAVLRCGLYGTPVNHRLRPDEATYIVANSNAQALIASAKFSSLASATAASLPQLKLLLSVDGVAPGFQVLDALSGPYVSADETGSGRLMLYTSGTTGTPRGVWRPLPDRYPETEAVQEVERFLARWPPNPAAYRGPHLVLGPMYHAQPLVAALHALHLGQPLVIAGQWDSEQVLDLIAHYHVTSSAMVPTMFHRLLNLPDDVRHRYDCTSLSRVIHAGAPCAVHTKLQMLKWWGPILDEYYAATEGGGTSVSAVEWLARPGTVGRPYPGANVKVLQASGEPCAAAQIGKVYLKVQAPFEYYKDPDTTLAGRHGDYFTLGDLGYLDEAGYLFLVDRESDVIISGGVNIYPAEIEGVLSGHPFIADAAVVGIPDDEWGERVHAIVELAQGTSESSLSSEEVIEYCRARLAAYKCPRSIEFRPDLPRLESGKLQRGKLRAAFWEGRARAI